MPQRQVVPTDDTLQNGKPLPRAYIAQVDSEFAQILANMVASMDNIVNNPEAPATAKVNAARELRQLLEVQMKLLNDIERRQDAQEMQNKTKNLRNMIAGNPRQALEVLEAEIKKLVEFREFVEKLATTQAPPVMIDIPKAEDDPFPESGDGSPF